MYSSCFDEQLQIFRATLTEFVEVNELALGLNECITADYAGELRALWNIAEMHVGFALNEVEQVVQVLHAGDVPSGKMAFVIGEKEFLRGVVQSVRSVRDDWFTQWRGFPREEDAIAWLTD